MLIEENVSVLEVIVDIILSNIFVAKGVVVLNFGDFLVVDNFGEYFGLEVLEIVDFI